jgi:hypothetical protein
MQYGGPITALIVVGLWGYAVLDALGADELLTRRLAKSVWLKVVLFLPLAGGMAWLLIGRPGPSAPSERLGFRGRRRMLDVEEFTQFVAGLQRASAGSRRAAQSWTAQHRLVQSPLFHVLDASTLAHRAERRPSSRVHPRPARRGGVTSASWPG